MSKQNKKRIQTQKKPELIKILLKQSMIAAVAAICFLMIIGSVAGYFYTMKVEENLDYSIYESMNIIIEKWNTADKEELRQNLIFEWKSKLYNLALVNHKTGEVVATTSDDIFFLRVIEKEGMSDDNIITLYGCEDAEIKDKILKEMEEDKYNKTILLTDIIDFYLDGNNFVPGKVQMKTYDNQVVKEFDFTPDNKEDYVYVSEEEINEIGEAILIVFQESFAMGDDSGLEEAIAKREERVESSATLSDVDIWGNIQCRSYVWIDGYSSVDEYCCLVGYSECNFFEEWFFECITVGCVTISIAFLCAIIFGYISYMRQKNVYEMDLYRRNLINTMAHDLKSPLMVISGYAENLLEQDLSEKVQHFSKSIMENTVYMNQIIEKTLELSRVENANYQLYKEDVNLREISQELINGYIPQLEERSLEIQMNGECILTADKITMTQVLDNLIANAVKYAMEATAIEIHLSDKTYEISNVSAVEFDMDVKDLFKPFVKGDNSRSGKTGSGIGLTIAKNLCEQQGYELSLECSEGVFVARVK